MARFRFRLQTVKKLREIYRDEQRARLAEAYEAERILAEQRAALAAEREGLEAHQRKLIEREKLDIGQLMSSQRYRLTLEAQSRTLAEQARKVADETERRRAALVEADREVKVLEKLRQRQADEHRGAVEAAEARRLDEAAANQWRARQWAR